MVIMQAMPPPSFDIASLFKIEWSPVPNLINMLALDLTLNVFFFLSQSSTLASTS
jgi:hypothetical protein